MFVLLTSPAFATPPSPAPAKAAGIRGATARVGGAIKTFAADKLARRMGLLAGATTAGLTVALTHSPIHAIVGGAATLGAAAIASHVANKVGYKNGYNQEQRRFSSALNRLQTKNPAAFQTINVLLKAQK